MIHLKTYSASVCVFVFLLLCSMFVVVAEEFGEIVDENGDPIEPAKTTEYGGLVYNVPSQQITTNYDGTSVDYSGLDGSLTFSEFGKIVEGDVTVDKAGEYVFGNMKLDLAKGAKVTFKDGELKIDDPGKTLSQDDVSFIDQEVLWDGGHITLSGDGVDFYGQSDVSLDKSGYFLQDPTDVAFDAFTVTGNGRVYLLEHSGETDTLDTTIPGAYVSVNRDTGTFTIGSNVFSESVAVKLDSDNPYGFRYDVDSDHIAMKVVGGGVSSYMTVRNREGGNLVPEVTGVGFFAMDNNRHGTYVAGDDKVYTTYDAHVISEFSAGAESTVTPVEVSFNQYVNGEVMQLSDYDGRLVIGNDGHIGYGVDPTYTVAGKYRESELRHGASNLLAYNYYQGDKETIERIFGFPIRGNRVGILKTQGKGFMDILFQTPESYRKYIRSVNLQSSLAPGVLGWADTGGDVSFAVDRGGFNQRVISHEFAHIFDFTTGRGARHIFPRGRGTTHPGYSEFSKYWAMINGDQQPPIRGAYTGIHEELIATFVEQQYRPLDSYWQAHYNGNQGVQKRVAALVLGDGITYYNGRKILEAIGAGPINSMEDVRRVITGGNTGGVT